MNRIDQERKVRELQAKQGWSDATMEALMTTFIFLKERRAKRFIKLLKQVQREENGS